MCIRDSCYGEGISLEITIHKFFAGLCNRLHQSFMVFLQVFGQVIRNRAFFLAGLVNVSSSGLFHNIDISYELAVQMCIRDSSGRSSGF